MSLKRKMIKKKKALQQTMDKIMQINKQYSKAEEDEKKKIRSELKVRRDVSRNVIKNIPKELMKGHNGKIESHINSYTMDFKDLISKLNDQGIKFTTKLLDEDIKFDPNIIKEKEKVAEILNGSNKGPEKEGDEKKE